MTSSILPRIEVIRRLRERSQPIRIFGETDEDSFQRLKQLEISDPEQATGVINDFKLAMDKVNHDISHSCQEPSSSSNKATDVLASEVRGSIEEMQSLIQELNPTNNFSDEQVISKDCDIMFKFLKFILDSWGKELNSRPMEEKTSQAGKNLSARYTSTKANLKPLFKLLKNRKISHDVLRLIKLIARELVKKNYKEATSHYIEMSVGNAAWPIGVTMVGIHARTGREKISQNNIAHALNDETQRKYVQAIKRLITQFSNMFPTDPSKTF